MFWFKITTPAKNRVRNELKHLFFIWILVGFQKDKNKWTALPV